MKSILVVDDQAEFIHLVSYKFDLISLDILMPGINGIEFLQYTQKKSPCAVSPGIFVSSASDIDVVSQAIKLGAMGYIKKSIDAKNLIKKIQAVIGE
ncbi:MAG: response regulator [Treponema sp.]|jgi:two-component system response regulator YesN|nr:response regulator [Treponema sp.]